MIEFGILLGDSIVETYSNMVLAARESNNGETYYFDANNIRFFATADSDINLAKNWLQKCYDYELKEIGPMEPVLDPEYIAQKEKENKERAERLAKEWEEQEAAEKKDLDKAIEIIGDFKPTYINKREYNKWFKNQTSRYGQICFIYAKQLASLLELRLKKNKAISKRDVYECEHMIRNHGISGYQHSAVTCILEHHWKYYNQNLFN